MYLLLVLHKGKLSILPLLGNLLKLTIDEGVLLNKLRGRGGLNLLLQFGLLLTKLRDPLAEGLGGTTEGAQFLLLLFLLLVVEGLGFGLWLLGVSCWLLVEGCWFSSS